VKFTIVVGDLAGPSARHRALCYRPVLEAQNVEVSVAEVPGGWFARRRFFRSLAESDLVLLQRRLLKPGDMARLRRFSARLVFDYDDALPYHVSARGAGRSRMRTRRFEAAVRAADLVIAGSESLADLARPIAENVRVIPTAIDTQSVLERPEERPEERDSSRTVLGWIGSAATLPYLEEIAPALETIAAREASVTLRIVADAPLEIPGLDVEAWSWREETEAADLATFDIGLAPLTDDAWARGKCGFRLLQYMAAGVPAVASPVGAQATILVDGETGRLASTPEEWAERVIELIRDRDTARAFGRAARTRAERAFSRRAWGPVFRDALLGLMETM